ncbi:MAG: extracellular solute-binding protein [bacterium]|nr:extracellular solute-binding protein [bacterium]
MNMKKAGAFALAAATALTMLTGCGGEKNAADTDEIMSRENVAEYKYPEQIELKIPVYDRGTAGQASVTDNYWTQYVQKEFADKHNIKMKFISIPRKEENTTFNQLLAGKPENQPDIIFNYDYPTIVSFADQGAFQKLDEEMIKKYAPTYYDRVKELDQYTMLDGERLFLAATRPRSYNYMTLVRKDWLDKCGLDIPKTDEEFINMLREFKKQKLGGEDTIPMTLYLKNAYYPNYNFRPYPMPEEENALYSDITVCSLTYGPTKEQLKYDNALYNEGLVSPEWYLDVDNLKAQSAFISGKAGVFSDYLSKNPDVIGNLKKNVPDAEVAFIPAHPMDGKVPAGRDENPFGMMSGININCAHPEAVLMYFEWLSQPENLYTMQNGIEGVTYNLEDDVPVLIDGYTGEERLNYNSNKDMWCLVTEGKDFGSDELNLKAQEKTYAPEGYEFLIRDSYQNYLNTKEYLYPDFIFDKPIESLSNLGETLKSKWQTIQVDLINCKPEEFETKYETACKEYLDAGYQQVLDEKKQAYSEMKNK